MSDLFSFGRGKVIDAQDVDTASGRTAYVTRTERNNGVDGFIDFDDVSYMNTAAPVITIGNETAAPFVHTYDFYTGTNINILSPRARASRQALMFISVCFKQQRVKYSYGYAASSTRLKNQKIQLPIDESGQPDYAFMERYIHTHEQRLMREYVARVSERVRSVPAVSLCGVKWIAFYLREVFSEIQRGRRLKTEDHTSGIVPYVSSSAMNNGVDDFIGNTSGVRKFKDCMNSGSVGKSFFHEYEFIASDHVTALKAPHMDKYIYLFIATITQRFSEKYSFNREINESRVNREKIMLPINEHGLPDWDFMHNFMRHIEAQKLSAVISHILTPEFFTL